MKLSEFKNHADKVSALIKDRRDLGNALAAVDAGKPANMYVVLQDENGVDIWTYPDFDPSSWPLVRAALQQTLEIVEEKLRQYGLDLDQPAHVDDQEEGPAEQPGRAPQGNVTTVLLNATEDAA